MSSEFMGAGTSRPEAEPLGLEPSFGFGDRLGCATPGHVAALLRSNGSFLPIFAQQSVREMARTARTAEQVFADAISGAADAGYAGRMGADADHLKELGDVDVTCAAGFVFFTIDPSEFVDDRADGYSVSELADRYSSVCDEVSWVERYRGRRVPLAPGRGRLVTHEECRRAAVKYGRAVNHTIEMARHIDRSMRDRGRAYEIEVSVDETSQPTTPAEHFIVADRCLDSGVKLVSVAPRFVGDFEKGVDYRGNLSDLERNVTDHAAIAEALGPYKLSLHSGSDKLSIYPMLARATKGRLHVKTAGTSYLEALRVAARCAPVLFREIIDFARSRYDRDKASYHVSATLSSAPGLAEVPSDGLLEGIYLGDWSLVPPGKGFSNLGRQIVHCTFGSVLTHPRLGPELKQVLRDHSSLYSELLADHFARHLDALEAGL